MFYFVFTYEVIVSEQDLFLASFFPPWSLGLGLISVYYLGMIRYFISIWTAFFFHVGPKEPKLHAYEGPVEIYMVKPNKDTNHEFHRKTH